MLFNLRLTSKQVYMVYNTSAPSAAGFGARALHGGRWRDAGFPPLAELVLVCPPCLLPLSSAGAAIEEEREGGGYKQEES